MDDTRKLTNTIDALKKSIVKQGEEDRRNSREVTHAINRTREEVNDGFDRVHNILFGGFSETNRLLRVQIPRQSNIIIKQTDILADIRRALAGMAMTYFDRIKDIGIRFISFGLYNLEKSQQIASRKAEVNESNRSKRLVNVSIKQLRYLEDIASLNEQAYKKSLGYLQTIGNESIMGSHILGKHLELTADYVSYMGEAMSGQMEYLFDMSSRFRQFHADFLVSSASLGDAMIALNEAIHIDFLSHKNSLLKSLRTLTEAVDAGFARVEDSVRQSGFGRIAIGGGMPPRGPGGPDITEYQNQSYMFPGVKPKESPSPAEELERIRNEREEQIRQITTKLDDLVTLADKELESAKESDRERRRRKRNEMPYASSLFGDSSIDRRDFLLDSMVDAFRTTRERAEFEKDEVLGARLMGPPYGPIPENFAESTEELSNFVRNIKFTKDGSILTAEKENILDDLERKREELDANQEMVAFLKRIHRDSDLFKFEQERKYPLGLWGVIKLLLPGIIGGALYAFLPELRTMMEVSVIGKLYTVALKTLNLLESPVADSFAHGYLSKSQMDLARTARIWMWRGGKRTAGITDFLGDVWSAGTGMLSRKMGRTGEIAKQAYQFMRSRGFVQAHVEVFRELAQAVTTGLRAFTGEALQYYAASFRRASSRVRRLIEGSEFTRELSGLLRESSQILRGDFTKAISRTKSVITAIVSFFQGTGGLLGKGFTKTAQIAGEIGVIASKIMPTIQKGAVLFTTLVSKFGPLFAKSVEIIAKVMNSPVGRFIAKAAGRIARLASKFFLPITVLLGAVETISGAVKGWKETNLAGAIIGGIVGLVDFLTFNILGNDGAIFNIKKMYDSFVKFARELVFIFDTFRYRSVTESISMAWESFKVFSDEVVREWVDGFATIIDWVVGFFGVENFKERFNPDWIIAKSVEVITELFMSVYNMIARLRNSIVDNQVVQWISKKLGLGLEKTDLLQTPPKVARASYWLDTSRPRPSAVTAEDMKEARSLIEEIIFEGLRHRLSDSPMQHRIPLGKSVVDRIIIEDRGWDQPSRIVLPSQPQGYHSGDTSISQIPIFTGSNPVSVDDTLLKSVINP